MTGSPDVLIVADPRFSGGTTAAVAADCAAFTRAGARVGLLLVASNFFADAPDMPNADMLALRDLDGVFIVPPIRPVRAGVAFFHHPLVFFHGVAERVDVRADRAVVVSHHPPFRGDGSLEFDPILTTHRIRRAFGITPWWAPISEVVRHQLRAFAPLIRLTSENWVNAFDPAAWHASRPVFAPGSVPTVGRHSRADPLKWPDTADDIAASLPAARGWQVRVMGCPTGHLRTLGATTDGWDVLAFNAEPVREFLSSLDVFSYFYSRRWVEAFGRTVVEAALCGRICVLDPRLAETFGNIGLYCAPAEVATLIERLRADPGTARRHAEAARDACLHRHGVAAIDARLARLATDRGEHGRRGAKQAGALTTLRKIAGLYRRGAFAGLAGGRGARPPG